MPKDRFAVGVIVARRKLKSPWADHQWLPVAALPDVPETEPWTLLASAEGEDRFYAGAHEVGLHISETGHYRDNLVSGRPSLWVALRHVAGDAYEVAAVTADPYEGEAMAEGIGEIVEPVAMPEAIQAVVAEFVAAFHIERTFEKRKRDRADPEALARGAVGGQRGGGTE
ncbi:hypothetical protein J2X36_002679 [Methylobacterium sp. BE186]|uniref:DUF3305 domain-containing protein n=1 Tax=Methylobacterium sp. BE186 TaxID=2817715 RepID=UPI002856646F|nr:DUF3305 domain-containing protein [Methylobacterium sp. BE186]MDR7037926.1 hypothetical protein [Methylobacterium sp. BE186]